MKQNVSLPAVDSSPRIGSCQRFPDNLPPEIEYEIFTLAFYNDKKGGASLLRVAERVSKWLIPLLYKVVIIADPPHQQPYPPIERLQQHGHHVRHLLVSSTPCPIAEEIFLSACPNVSDLAFWSGAKNIAQVLSLSITRLQFEDTDFVGAKLWDLPKTPQIQQWCSCITHVVLGSYLDDTNCAHNLNVLTLLPSLSHFMTFCWNEAPVIRGILVHCPQLKVFVWLWGKCNAEDLTQVVEGRDECPVDDPRIVTLNGSYVSDWIRGAQGEDDLWILAEREIRRKGGDI
ncbi:hypothetical protein BDN72DRAFT_850245 [Pluteus cervinus]|uniref:Uncharacterized protein n=1 Tax=Pluteus cervinus TaxID=181527 RepID=A0ACD3A5Z8_9AGAR|nr:hypothetical protein BDN72DRAFT_850245 [Pluteus cervinus]